MTFALAWARWGWAGVRRLSGRLIAPGILRLVVVLLGLFALRVYRLDAVPLVATADELDNLQVAYRLIAGTGPGTFGLDWKAAPVFSLYPLAWSVRVFGDGIAAFRMFPVLQSMAVLVMTYVLARRSMSEFAALLAVVMLGTNLWFLHFSRTAWENSNAALFAVCACWAVGHALEGRSMDWWGRVGLFAAAGMYGYFSGRTIPVAIAVAVLAAVLLRQACWRPAVRGLVFAGAMSALLFLPQAVTIARDWDHFNRRTEAVSILNGDPYDGESGALAIARLNLERSYRAFILQDPGEMQRGLWARYNPARRPPLDFATAHLFWAGLIVAAWRWRATLTWWPFLIPLALAEVFSRGTPDLARGIVFAPFYFLFCAFALDQVLSRVRRFAWRSITVAVMATAVSLIAYMNVTDYFEWQDERTVQVARFPGVDACEFAAWEALARDAASRGALVDPADVTAATERVSCSSVRPPP
jgi:4-amino-4-deoxy-L-arabinose transferase-like glycosyltransferase